MLSMRVVIVKPPPMLIAEASTAVAARPYTTKPGGMRDVIISTAFLPRHLVKHQEMLSFLPASLLLHEVAYEVLTPLSFLGLCTHN